MRRIGPFFISILCIFCRFLSLFRTGRARTCAKVWCVMDTDPLFLLPPHPLRHVPDMLGCLESPGTKEEEGRTRDGYNNKPFESPSEGTTRTPTRGWMDRWWKRQRRNEKVKELVSFAHITHRSVRPGASRSQEIIRTTCSTLLSVLHRGFGGGFFFLAVTIRCIRNSLDSCWHVRWKTVAEEWRFRSEPIPGGCSDRGFIRSAHSQPCSCSRFDSCAFLHG